MVSWRPIVEPQPGTIVGEKYVLEQMLGRGGMGVVYRARHRITDRVVALKWLLEDDLLRRERFLREARAMGRLSHPNVVGVLDVGDHEGAIFLVMDYLEGKSLRDLIDAGPRPPAEAIALLMPALGGVAAAHQAGILHRDLKPENLFVLCDRDGTPYDTKVLDFGVAKPFGHEHGQASLTHSGALVGTPRYMAPEQLGEETKLDPRCDLYSLGLILYELLTGQLPYRAKSLNALLIEILTGNVRSPKDLRPELPEELSAEVLRALARERDDRHADVASFAKALEPWGDGVRFEAPRRVHTPASGETDPGVARAAREASAATVRAPTPPASSRPSLPTTKSERPGAARKNEVSGTEPTVDAGSLDVAPRPPHRSPWIRIGIGVAALVIAGIAAASFVGGEDEASATSHPAAPEPTEPAHTVPARTEPARNGPAPPSAPTSPAVAVPSAPPALPAGNDPPEVEAPPAAPPSRAHRDHRHASAPQTVQEPPPPAQSDDPLLRVRTRAGTLEADDF